MKANRIWIALFFLIFVGFAHLSSKAIFSLYQFLSLRESAPLDSIKPTIKKLKKESYTLTVAYSYRIKETLHSKEGEIRRIPYKNRWVAQEALLKFQDSPHKVWFNPRKPNEAILDKTFPFKELIHFFLFLGILAYFCLLRKHILKKKAGS